MRDKQETTGTADWHPHEYSPGANPHNDGSDNPLGLAPVVQAPPEPDGAQTGNTATDRGGAASGAGAGSRADKADLAHKADQAAAVTGQPPAGHAVEALGAGTGTSDSSGGGGGGNATSSGGSAGNSGTASGGGGKRHAGGNTAGSNT